MGADEGALIALDAVLGDPLGNVDRRPALLVLGGPQRDGTISVVHKRAHGQVVPLEGVHGDKDLPDVARQVRVTNPPLLFCLLSLWRCHYLTGGVRH